MRKKIITALLIVSILAFSGCGENETSNETLPNGQNAEATFEEQSTIEEVIEFSEDLLMQLEVSEYIFEDTDSTLHILVIENNSDKTISVSSNSTALDIDGNAIGESSGSVEAIGPGAVSYIVEEFSDVKNVSECEYELKASETGLYESVVEDIETTIDIISEKAVASFTNAGNGTAEYIQGLAIFTKEGIVVDVVSQDVADSNSQFDPGMIILNEFISENTEFDDVQVYLRGYKEIEK